MRRDVDAPLVPESRGRTLEEEAAEWTQKIIEKSVLKTSPEEFLSSATPQERTEFEKRVADLASGVYQQRVSRKLRFEALRYLGERHVLRWSGWRIQRTHDPNEFGQAVGER